MQAENKVSFSESFDAYAFVGSALGALMLAFAFGLFVQAPWAMSIWPWEIKRLSAIFLSSICAAIAAPVLWICITRNFAAAMGGSINLMVAGAGMATYVFQTSQSSQQTAFAYAMVGMAVYSALNALKSRSNEFIDKRPTPWPVRCSFALFAVVLVVVGVNLVTNTMAMFPWPLKPVQNVLYGWIFLGAASYFVFGVLKPVWSNAIGQLLGFLAYDVVLIVPYCQHFATVPPELHRNLVIYVAVLVFSGLLATWYLFIDREYRFGGRRQSL